MNRSKYVNKLVALILLIIVAIVFVPFMTKADSKQYDDFLVEANSTSDININLFDYWLTTEEDDDTTTMGAKPNEGINQNHILLFGNSMNGVGDWNTWTGDDNTPVTNIVKPVLDEDGYPILNISEQDISSIPSLVGRKNESLAYLFNPEYESDYKKSYTNVSGLLMHSEELGDNYDCYKNFAFYDKESNSIKLMNQPAVMGIEAHPGFGQFFPLASLENIFTIENNELSTSKSITAQNGKLNHYLGMTLDAKFKQPENGIVKNDEIGSQQDMVFQFTGDDDIWIFIDGVLIADIGGIHNAITTNINFSTGKISIRPRNEQMVNTNINVFEYYLGEKYEAVQNELSENYMTENFIKETDENGNITKYTFKDNTSHELKIFYLERGNGGSSLEMSFWPSINGILEDSTTEPEIPGTDETEEPDDTEPESPPVTDNNPSTSPDAEESYPSQIESENPETSDYILIVITTLIIAIIVGIGIVKGYRLHLKKINDK